MSWAAILPLKQGPERKSRLASRLSPPARAALSDRMAAHVLRCLGDCRAISRIIVLSPRPYGAAEWRRDEGRGLNAELRFTREALRGLPLLVVHGDLPLLQPADVDALLQAAEKDVAIAPDRHRIGTNALAIPAAQPFVFSFGDKSLEAHRPAAGRSRIIERVGLALDIDTPDDLDAAIALGFQPAESEQS